MTARPTIRDRVGAAVQRWFPRTRSSLGPRIVGALIIVLVVSTGSTFLIETRMTRTTLEAHATDLLREDLRVLRKATLDEQMVALRGLRSLAQTLALTEGPIAAGSTAVISELGRATRDLGLDSAHLFDGGGERIGGVGPRVVLPGSGEVTTLSVPSTNWLLRTHDGTYLSGAIVPFDVAGDRFILIGGRLFDDAAAFRWRQSTGEHVLLIADGDLVGSTASDPEAVLIGGEGQGIPDSPTEVTLDGTSTLVAYERLPRPDVDWAADGAVGVAIVDPVAQLDQSLTRHRATAAVGLSLLAVILGLVLFLRLTRPLSRLSDTADRIAAGDLDAPFEAESEDEIGQLGSTLEVMRQSLREQLDLIHAQAMGLRESAQRIVGVRDEERRRIAHDLHDGAQQRLVITRLRLGELLDRLDETGSEIEATARRVAEELDASIEEVRAVMNSVYPPMLRDRGLARAVRSLAGRSPVPIEVRFEPEDLPRFDPTLEANVYFLLSEAVTNALKHAHADRIGIIIQLSDDVLRVSVVDDGVGMSADRRLHSGGLVSMRDRATATGGTFAIESEPGQGTRVTAEFPVSSPAPLEEVDDGGDTPVELGGLGETELGEDRARVLLDGPFGDAQHLGDRRVGPS